MGRETVLTTAQWKAGEFPTFTPVRGIESGPLPLEDTNIPGSGYAIHTARCFAPISYAISTGIGSGPMMILCLRRTARFPITSSTIDFQILQHTLFRLLAIPTAWL